jgi:uncharacterized protein
MMEEEIQRIFKSVEKWCIDNKIPDDHGFLHYSQVTKHASLAIDKEPSFTAAVPLGLSLAAPLGLSSPSPLGLSAAIPFGSSAAVPLGLSAAVPFGLTPLQKQAIILAALLHDVDDPKVASFLSSSLSTAKPYPIASSFLSATPPGLADLVLEMISYVSCSTNGDTCLKNVPKWKYIPRDADRSQAIGSIGIKRCFEYTQRTDRYLITKDTPLVYDYKSLDLILSKRSLESYVKSGGKSVSMVDHYYDKLLHLQPTSNNVYMIHLFQVQHRVMKRWLFHFCGFLSMCEIQGDIKCSKQELVLIDEGELD